VGFLRNFDGFEVALLGKAGGSPIGGAGGGTRAVGGRVKLGPEDPEDERPPGLGSPGGSLERGVRGMEGSDPGKLRIEPGFQGGFCQERKRRGNKQLI